MAKSLSKTPAPTRDRIKGSKVNPKGSASSEKSATEIKFDAKTIIALNNKLKEFREKHSNENITLNDLKAVYRRGLGAYSTSHRPNITRGGWAMARVNKFLLKAGGTKVKKAYVQDDDLMKYANGGEIDKLIDDGVVELKMFSTTNEHSKIYGFDAENPLYVQTLIVSKSHRMKGIGTKVMQYIVEYADKNGHDLIFGHITQKAEPNIDVIKSMLQKSNFKTIDGNNDFYKLINVTDIKYVDGGEVGQDIKCRRCGWEWNTSQSEEFDKYVCHNCGFDNRTFYDVDPIGYADGGEVKSFYDWYTDWYKRNKNEITIMISLPNELQPYKENNVVIINEFKKERESVKAYTYLQQMLNKSDEFGITIYLEPTPIGNVKTKSELIDYYKKFGFEVTPNKEFIKRLPKYKDGGEVDDKKKTYAKWKSLVNMSYGEIKKFYDSKEGKQAGLSSSEANKQGISSGRESARMLMKMKITSKDKWTDTMWKWANKQISFISRMSGMQGELYDDKGNKTRKHTSLLIWGHNPKKNTSMKYNKGGVLIPQQGTLYTKDKKSKLEYYKKGNDYAFKVYDVENNPVQNYTRNQYKNKGKDEVLMTYNQFINYLDSELYIDSKIMADGGELKGLTQSDIDTNVHKVATKFKLPLEYINSQLKLGIKFEMEHTKDKSIASKIALDHLNESPYYYQKLSEMEKELDTMKMDADTYLPKIMSAYANGGEVDMIFKLNTPTKQPTKLNYIQQILVRTTEFKNWFGDWEKCAESFLQDKKSNFLQHYKNCSIVIDLTTLEPQVVYHGTNFKEEFYTFDVTKKEGVGRPYGYFADNIEYSQNFTTNSQRGQHGLELLYKCFLNIRNPFMAITEDFYDELDNQIGWGMKISKVIAKKNYGENITDEQWAETLKVVLEQIGTYIYATFGYDDKPFWLLMARDTKKEFKYFLMSHGFDGVRYAEEFKGVYDVDNPAEFTKAWTIFDANQVKLADGRNIDFDPFKEDIRYEEGGSLTELNQEDMQQENMSKAQMLRNTIGINKFAEGGTVKGDGKHTNDAKKGGFFDGRSHAEGGIKAVNKDTGQMLEVEGNEVIINKRSVADNTKREFEGKMMTNKEILSTINEMGGGVSFKEGGEINEKSCKCMGKKYKFGGNLISDFDIVKELTTSYNDVIKKPISNSVDYVENLINKINGNY